MRLVSLFVVALVVILGTSCAMTSRTSTSLDGRVVCLDPGHGGTAETDQFRVGPTGEREEWVNLRVALLLRDMLEEAGARVVMTRTEDVAVSLKDRADLALAENADLFLSLHHNATADPSVNFPIVYYHNRASENQASVLIARLLGEELRAGLFNGNGPVSVVSDRTIFPNSGTSVLRNSYGIPGVIGEASFFTNPDEEARLRDPAYNRREAQAYLRAIERYFAVATPPVLSKDSSDDIPAFTVFQEAERMNDEARRWKENFVEGREAVRGERPEEGLRLLELSARSFPDSPVARDCHLLRAEALDQLGRSDDAATARRRAEEYYVFIRSR